MFKKLTTADINALILGSSIYSTGGGFDIENQKKQFEKMANKLPELITIDDLDDDDYVCTAYGVGPAVEDTSENKIDYSLALKEFEKITGKKVKAIFAGEINIESLVFETAAKLNLPVLDGDCCGGRAVPEIQMDTFFAQGIPITPALMINTSGEQLLYFNTQDNFKLEKIARNFAIVSKTSVFILDHLINVREAKKALTLRTLTRSLETGKFISNLPMKEENIQKIADQIQSNLVFGGKVFEVNLKIEGGFLVGSYSIKNSKGDIMKIQVKNENMIAYINQEIQFKSPDSIILLDSKNCYGMHNSKIKKGDDVFVLIKESVDDFKTQRGKKLFE